MKASFLVMNEILCLYLGRLKFHYTDALVIFKSAFIKAKGFAVFLKRFIFSALVLPILFVFNASAYALPFNITPKAGTVLPTNVVPGRNAIAYYTVQNSTLSQRNNNFVKYLPRGVTQTTNGGTYNDTCGGAFNLAPVGQAGDSCTLQLSISGAVDVNDTPNLMVCVPGGMTCAGTPYQLSVSVVSAASLVALNITPSVAILYSGATQQFTATGLYSDNSSANLTASTIWSASNPSAATISTLGVATAIALGSTTITATADRMTSTASLSIVSTPVVSVALTPSTVTINGTFNIVFNQLGFGANKLSATLPGGMSFVGTDNCTVSQSQSTCSLTVNAGASNGNFPINAQVISGSATLTPANPLMLQVNRPLFLYMSAYSNKLNKCPVSAADGTFTATCLPLTNQGTAFLHTSATAFNVFNNQSYVYVGDASATLWQCPLNSNGDFNAACLPLTNSGTPFGSTRNTTFQNFSGTTYAYVSDDSMTLWQCPMDSTTGSFSGACTALSVSTDTNSEIYQTTFASFSGTTYAYVADHSFGLWICPMNSTGGFSASCTAFINSPPFSATVGVTFNTFNGATYAYVADDSTTVWQCPMNIATGMISNYCTGLTNINQAFFHATSVNFSTFSGTTYAYIVDQTNAMWRCAVDTTTGAFGSSCTSINSSNFIGDALGASFYTP
jgi:energy-converting hydrogenase Eha subunit A